MLNNYPAFIDPIRLAQDDCLLRGQFAVEQLLRIQNSLCSSEGDVTFEWSFTTNEQQQPLIQGWVRTQLQMICQRCLQKMTWPLDIQVALVILTPGQRDDDLSLGYEALVVTKTPLSLVSLIEDEIILALPIAVTHTECTVNDYCLPDRFREAPVERNNPFQILRSLKTKQEF